MCWKGFEDWRRSLKDRQREQNTQGNCQASTRHSRSVLRSGRLQRRMTAGRRLSRVYRDSLRRGGAIRGRGAGLPERLGSCMFHVRASTCRRNLRTFQHIQDWIIPGDYALGVDTKYQQPVSDFGWTRLRSVVRRLRALARTWAARRLEASENKFKCRVTVSC